MAGRGPVTYLPLACGTVVLEIVQTKQHCTQLYRIAKGRFIEEIRSEGQILRVMFKPVQAGDPSTAARHARESTDRKSNLITYCIQRQGGARTSTLERCSSGHSNFIPLLLVLPLYMMAHRMIRVCSRLTRYVECRYHHPVHLYGINDSGLCI